jgi:hypothetical protein
MFDFLLDFKLVIEPTKFIVFLAHKDQHDNIKVLQYNVEMAWKNMIE